YAMAAAALYPSSLHDALPIYLLVPAGRKGKRGKVPYSVRFHLGPGVEVGLSGSGRGATLALPDGGYWQFLAVDHELEIDESLWVDRKSTRLNSSHVKISYAVF